MKPIQSYLIKIRGVREEKNRDKPGIVLDYACKRSVRDTVAVSI
ncbi:hypothetical protein NIES2109_36790 [Nostoc sp. HK-01]|uniref:Uncharacterized protein n=1 Tax=Anabaenopsis circularis NIES-21 TaxID=1085406 RepID=A0A1Z4GBR0_9CYAN|nr:hypothetical protein NIES21_07490 [Anabaenopsis circularis NIES-21]BBD60879.1 hypothetical protein NIES2109_36790 [Nostoc sp. HK-01]